MPRGPDRGHDGGRDGGSDRVRVAIAAGFLAVYAVLCVQAVWTVPFPNNYDELAHLSSMAWLRAQPLRTLDLEAMRLLRPELGPGFGPAGNYLNHPPTYYLVLGWLLPGDGWPTADSVHLVRLVNAGLSTAAVGLALWLGVLRRLEPVLMVLFGASVVLVPVLQVTGSGVSNDNLALLGGCMAVFGAQAMVSGRVAGVWLLLAGCVLASLAKFTAAIMVGVFAAVFLAARVRRLGWRRLLVWLGALAAAEAVACVPYGWFMLRFGSPVPVTAAFVAVGAEAAARRLTVNGWVPGWQLGLAAYAVQFGRWMIGNWSPVLGVGGLAGVAVLAAPVLMLGLAVPGFVLNPPGWRGRDPVLGAGAVALVLTLVPHLVFSWQRYHLALGAPPFDAVPRYYLPVALALVPAAACWTLGRLPRAVGVTAAVAVLAATVAVVPILAACHDGGCW